MEYPRISASCGRRTIGLFLAPLLTVAFLVLPMDIPREQQVAQAMLKHGVARRFAFRILALSRAGRSTTGVILAFGAITCLLSAFVSNTAMVAMLLPTAIGILSIIAKLLHQRGDVV